MGASDEQRKGVVVEQDLGHGGPRWHVFPNATRFITFVNEVGGLLAVDIYEGPTNRDLAGSLTAVTAIYFVDTHAPKEEGP